MSEPLIQIAKAFTGKILTGNPNMPNGSKALMSKVNDLIYRR